MSASLVWTPSDIEVVNRAKPIDINVFVIDPYSTQLPPIESILAQPYDIGDQHRWYYIPRQIDLGGDINSTDFSKGLNSLTQSSDTQLIGGQECYFLSTDYDVSNANYDKFSIDPKASVYPYNYQDSARCVIQSTVSGTTYLYGIQSLTFNPSTTPTDLNGTPPANHFYYSLYGGHLYLSKNLLNDVSGRIKLKLYYQGIGWSL